MPIKLKRQDDLDHFHPRTRRAWRQWLSKHHATSAGVWLVIDKAASGNKKLPYDAIVEEALCFGWIDGKANSIDAATFKVLYKPRNPNSGWSAINKARVERLTTEGLMAPAGLAKIEEAKRTGSWSKLDAAESLAVPDDLAKALRANKPAAATYAAWTPSSRKVLLAWITSAKKPETREKRVAEVVRRAARGGRADDRS